jgi:hypothetical protein
MNAPTIIAAQPGYFLATLSYDGKIEFMPLIAWAVRPHYPDPESGYTSIDVIPVTTFGKPTHDAWLIKHPGGQFTDRYDDFISTSEQEAISYLEEKGKKTVGEYRAAERQKLYAAT